VIAWGYWLTFPDGHRELRVLPGMTRSMVRALTEARTLCTKQKTKVVKVDVSVLPQCGCGLVDDVGVTCRRHTLKVEKR